MRLPSLIAFAALFLSICAQRGPPASRHLTILPLGDDNLLGSGTVNRTTARYLLKNLLMFDDFVVQYVGPHVDSDGLQHYCMAGEAPIPKDGRDADHIIQGTSASLKPQYNVAIVLLGTHDCYRMGAAFDRIFRSISTLDRHVQFLRGPKKQNKVFLCKLPRTLDDKNECTAAYSELLEENISAHEPGEGEEGVTLVDLGLHKIDYFDHTMYRTNEEGQRQIASALYAAIKKWHKEKTDRAKQEL